MQLWQKLTWLAVYWASARCVGRG